MLSRRQLAKLPSAFRLPQFLAFRRQESLVEYDDRVLAHRDSGAHGDVVRLVEELAYE